MHSSTSLVLFALGAVALLAETASAARTAAAPAVNKFYARYSYPPLDPQREQGYWPMPRTEAAAKADKWAVVAGHEKRADGTALYLRQGDYRVGLLFDRKGSVAGVVSSVSLADITTSKTPFSFAASDEWFRQKLVGVEVYSTVAYFVSKATLAAGGRTLTDASATAPQLELLRVRPGATGQREKGRKAVASTQARMNADGWVTMGCFVGQGLHNYEGLSKKTSCSKLRTYFPITHPTAHTLTALGVTFWGKVSDSGPRPWLEEVLSKNIRGVVTDGPDCMWQQIDEFGLYTIHLFFNEQPWAVPC